MGVRCLVCGSRLCIVRMGPHSSEAVPCVDGMANIPVISLTAETVLNRGLGSVNCNANLCEGDPCVTIGIPMFDFRGLVGISGRLNPRVGSANRILNITNALRRTLCGKLVNTNCGVGGGNNIFVAIHGSSGTRVNRVTGGCCSLKFEVCTARNATSMLGGCNVSTMDMGGVRRSGAGGALALVRSNGVRCIVSASTGNEVPSESSIGVHHGAIREGVPYLASLSATGTLTSYLGDRCSRRDARLVSVGRVERRGLVLGFAGVRNVNGSCVCYDAFSRRVDGPRTLTMELSSERFNVNNSNVVLIYPSGITSTGVGVCGLSNSRNGVYNGNVHYMNGFLCSRNVISVGRGSRVAVRALDNVGGLGTCASNKGIGHLEISVNGTVLRPGRVPIILSNSGIISEPIRVTNGGCGVAYMSVNGPRYIMFVSSVSGLSVRAMKPRFRGSGLFPREIGARFMAILSSRAVGVEI